jgi:hypothetical protein
MFKRLPDKVGYAITIFDGIHLPLTSEKIKAQSLTLSRAIDAVTS